MTATVHVPRPRGLAAKVDIAARVAVLDWAGIAAELDAHGCAITGALLTPAECAALAGAYAVDHLVRSRVIMARHGFGRGEYKYFAYPLPEPIAALRAALYPALAVIANRWNEAMGIAVRYPHGHQEFLDRCRDAGQTKPTPLLLQYREGDYNCLHQDIYGEHVFPLQITLLLSRPNADFSGGDFVLTEQAAAHAVARRGRAARSGRGRDLSGPPSSGARHPRHLSGQHAPRREPAPFGATAYRRDHIS
jgi:uncharacterized protein